eukprot:7204579-Pyramimonas_sp.AAC.1
MTGLDPGQLHFHGSPRTRQQPRAGDRLLARCKAAVMTPWGEETRREAGLSSPPAWRRIGGGSMKPWHARSDGHRCTPLTA